VEAAEGDTMLSLKRLIPVRLLRNGFFDQVRALEDQGATPETLQELLGKGRTRKGMFEGDLDEGELEIGQVSALINRIQPAGEIVREIVEEYGGRDVGTST
jgi:enoyl-[acyl-carrier protein] reductase II